MAEVGSAFISIAPSLSGFGRDLTSQANRELDPASKKIGSGFGSKLGLAMKTGLAAGGVALAAFGKASLDAASDAQQSIGATETVFGKFAKTVISSSNDAAQAYGLSANEYRENANLLGALFKNQGVALSDLGGATDDMIGKASDLAATFGGTTSEAVGALGAAFKGEFDSLEKYGISLKASTIQAELAARGQDKLTGAALAAATQQATTDLIFRQSKDSLGAFGRESDTLAGQQQRLGAQFENFKATIGTALLPVVTQFFGYLNSTALPALTSLGSYLSTNFGPAFERVRTVVSGFLGGSSGDVGGWAANIKSIFTDVVTIATRLWNTFGVDIVRYATTFLKNTQQIIGGGLNVVAGIFKTISALMKGDWSGAWNGIKQIASGAKDVVVGLMKQLFNLLQTAVSVGWKAIKGLFSTAVDGLTKLIRTGLQAQVDFFKNLPSRIVNVLGDLGSLLLDIGRDIVDGLWDGLKEKWESVKQWFGDITSSIPDLKGPAEKDKKLLTPAGQMIMEGLIDGIVSKIPSLEQTLSNVTTKFADSFTKVRGILESERDRITGVLDNLRSAFDSVKTSVTSAFTPDLLGSATYNDFILGAGKSMGELSELKKAFRTLRGWGVPGAFLSQLFASGNAGLILDLASQGKFEAQTAALAFDQTNALAGSLGAQVGGNQFRPEIDRVVNKLDRLERAIDRVGPAVGKAVNGAASAGQRSAGPTSSGGRRGR